MQITDLEQEQQITPLFRLGFRPFFLFGSIFSVISLLLWLFILKGTVNLHPLGGGYWWHIHEMIYGFGGAIIAGFLLTAVQNWTGFRGTHGKALIMLFLLWLAARILLIFPHFFGVKTTIIIDLSFLPAVAFVLAKPIVAIKQYRNLFFVPLLLMFTLANLSMHLSLFFPKYFMLNLSGYTGVLLVTFLMSVMAGRVVPMFTANGTKTEKVNANPILEKVIGASLVIATLTLLLHPVIDFNPNFFAILLVISGVFQAMRWLRWRPWITLAVPLLWSLHIALLFIWLGLILLGLSYLLPHWPSNHIWHLLTIGGMGGLILAMISRVSLGHTGRLLTPPKLMILAYIAIFLATIMRSLGPWLMPSFSQLFYDASVFLWLVAFGIFSMAYGPMLMKARTDGRPG